MKDIEEKISPLIAGLFPSFYQAEGPNFITFVQAYYEWLEQNFQLLELESITNFNVGDTVTQQNVTGTIYSIEDNSILVLVDGLETFKCFNVCSELIPITSSSGGDTYILRGGTTRRLGSIFLGRNLFNMRDIDSTLDLFVVKFKEKYLKNIEFDTQTNKRLLVKNSLDLYRSKGTSRSIDLFFRLIYGVKSSVYYPGDDLFRLSDGEWFKPQYIEINSTSTSRAITLVGKQITGVDSGATAFVERYIKKKVNDGIIHVFYVSNVKGQFLVDERLKSDRIYSDSPKIVGSLNSAVVLDGSENFSIGDIVNLRSQFGTGGQGRVTAVVNGTGEVRFELIDSGWGYTTNRIGDPNTYAANTFLTDKILLLANVEPSQQLSSSVIVGGGTGYTNGDIINVISPIENGRILITTNSAGGIVTTSIINKGNGFYPEITVPPVSITNSTGFATTGSGAGFSFNYQYPGSYFRYLEQAIQPLYNITYNNPVNISEFVGGAIVDINNTNKLGKIISVDATSNNIVISMFNNEQIFNGDVVYIDANTSCTVNVLNSTRQIANGTIIYNSSTGVIDLGIPTGSFAVGDTIYQQDSSNTTIASAVITKTAGLTLAGGLIECKDISGVFKPNTNVFVLNKTSYANFKSISLTIGIVKDANNFTDVFSPYMYTTTSGTKAFVTTASTGSNAQYRISSLKDTQIVRVNTDRLSNNTLRNTRLNAVAFGFPYNPTANVSSNIYGTLNFENLTVGSIDTLGNFNPGEGYNVDPIASVFQPYVTSYRGYDYIFDITNPTASFNVGEYIQQTNYYNYRRVFVSNTMPYRLGEKVYAGNTTVNYIANGIINYIDGTNNYLDLKNPVGTFPTTNNYNIKSFITVANSYIVNSNSFANTIIARGIVKDIAGNKIYVKRIQLVNEFVTGNTVTGASSGARANLVTVSNDTSSKPAGLNASVLTDALTANGIISQLQITDSGFGFSNDTDIELYVDTDDRTGLISNIKGGLGTGAGYYRNNKGFLSDLSKIHDGDYYQEYSYDILSKIPLDKYASMFKKVMHTAGTRFFGTVSIDSVLDAAVALAVSTTSNSALQISNSSPYTVQDRQDINVQDRSSFYIEIRE